MCNIQPVIRPDTNLNKMLTFMKIMLIINLLSTFLRIFIKPSDMLFDFFCTLFLFLAYRSIYFLYMAIYIVFCLINGVYLFINSATIFQMLLQNTLGDLRPKVPLILGISLYLLVFYTFAIIYAYPTYKEMKAQLMENLGGSNPIPRSRIANRQDRDEERPPINTNTTNNNSSAGGFQAFSGRGVAVGGG